MAVVDAAGKTKNRAPGSTRRLSNAREVTSVPAGSPYASMTSTSWSKRSMRTMGDRREAVTRFP